MKYGGHLEKFGGQNPQNSKEQGGHAIYESSSP